MLTGLQSKRGHQPGLRTHHQKAGASADAAPNSAAIAHAAPSARLRPDAEHVCHYPAMTCMTAGSRCTCLLSTLTGGLADCPASSTDACKHARQPRPQPDISGPTLPATRHYRQTTARGAQAGACARTKLVGQPAEACAAAQPAQEEGCLYHMAHPGLAAHQVPLRGRGVAPARRWHAFTAVRSLAAQLTSFSSWHVALPRRDHENIPPGAPVLSS